MMGLVLAVLLIVAAALLFGRGKKGGEDVTEAAVAEESTDAFGGDRISQDVFVDYSAIAGAGENAQLNLSGMTRSEAGEALKSKYQWSLKVLNSNPNLDKFEMPNIPETEDTSSETGADAEGTVYEVTVDDPLAAVKIRPTKSEFEVPDAVGGEIDSLLDRIFQDYENGALPVKEESESTAADSSEARTADYTLVLPDFSELAADYASQLATVWEVKPKNGDIVSYDKDNDSHQHVADSHKRNQNACGLLNSLSAAHDAHADQCCHDKADDGRSHALFVEAVSGEGGLYVIGAEQIETEGVGEQQEHDECCSQSLVVQSILDVVSRAAVAGSVAVFPLVHLGQGTLGKGRCTADQSHDGHPEYRSGAAEADRSGYADNITGSNAGCGGNHQCLER